MLISLVNYALMFFVFSAIGWTIECIYCSIGNRKLITRGFLYGPVCPIYGTGALVFEILITPLSDPIQKRWWLVVLVGMVLADIVEYLTSYIMEKLFNARWWDYSNEKFNLHGRICLKHSIYWALATVAVIYIVQPFLQKHMERLVSDELRNFMIAFVGTVFIIDYVITWMNARKKKYRNTVSSDNRIIED